MSEPSYRYVRDPHAIYRQSFATIRAEADLSRVTGALEPLVVRLIHACGMLDVVEDLAWSTEAVDCGRKALQTGAPVLVDTEMVGRGVIRSRLPAGNEVVCTLGHEDAVRRASEGGMTRSAAAVELWQPRLAGAVVAIGNAPTALFRLLEMIDAGVPAPAVVLAFPVGFVGAAESKEALIGHGAGLPFVTLRGRRGGSAMAAAAVNALTGTAAE